MNNTRTVLYIRFIFLAMSCALFFAWTANVAHADTAGAQVSIAPTGQVIVRDAKVISISGDTITARSAWGAMSITWTVETNGSTRFVPDAGSVEAILAIKTGDFIAFSGELDTGSGQASVRATVVKDAALQKDSVVQSGSVLNINPAGRSFVIDSGDATTTVEIVGGTILTRDGNMASLADLSAGDSVKVFGSLNTVTDTISAGKITWKSSSEAVSGPPGGVFAGLISWFEGNRGLFSSR